MSGIRTTPHMRAEFGRYDLMSYELPQWISAYSYCKLITAISDNELTCPDELAKGRHG